jgi:hypothetical protein
LDKDGFLLRCGDRQGLEQLLMDLMARSPHGKWPGSANFGLRDFLEDARTDPASLRKAVPLLNLALEELGAAVRAQDIIFTPGAEPGTGTVEFSLTGPNGQGERMHMTVES